MASHGMHAHPSPGVSIDYFAAGEGRPVVLVHGITESRRAWDPLIAPLIAAGYRVIAIDLRGHGASSKVAPYDLATMAGDLGAVLAEERIGDLHGVTTTRMASPPRRVSSASAICSSGKRCVTRSISRTFPCRTSSMARG